MASTPIPGRPVRGSTTGRPIMALFDLVGRRWALRIVWELREGDATFRDLAHRCDDVSSSVLRDRLRDLTVAGIVLSPWLVDLLAQRAAGLDPRVATRCGFPVTQGRLDARDLVAAMPFVGALSLVTRRVRGRRRARGLLRELSGRRADSKQEG